MNTNDTTRTDMYVSEVVLSYSIAHALKVGASLIVKNLSALLLFYGNVSKLAACVTGPLIPL